MHKIHKNGLKEKNGEKENWINCGIKSNIYCIENREVIGMNIIFVKNLKGISYKPFKAV